MTRHKKLLGRLLPCVYAFISTYHRWKFIHISESFFYSTECVTSDIESLISFSFRCSCHNTRLVFPIDIFTFFSVSCEMLFCSTLPSRSWQIASSFCECLFTRLSVWRSDDEENGKGVDCVAVEIAPLLRLFWHFPLFLINMNRQHQHGIVDEFSTVHWTHNAMSMRAEHNRGEKKSN